MENADWVDRRTERLKQIEGEKTATQLQEREKTDSQMEMETIRDRET